MAGSRGSGIQSAGWSSYPSIGEVNPQPSWQEIPESELYEQYEQYEQYDWNPYGKQRKVKQLNQDKRHRLREQKVPQNQTPRRVKKQVVRGKEKKRWNGILGIFGI